MKIECERYESYYEIKIYGMMFHGHFDEYVFFNIMYYSSIDVNACPKYILMYIHDQDLMDNSKKVRIIEIAKRYGIYNDLFKLIQLDY